METLPEETQDIPIEKKIKNPWWVKGLIHYIIIGMFMDFVFDNIIALSGILFPIFVLMLWVVILGPRIQSDKIILSKQIRVMLIFFAVWTTWEQYANVIKIIQWIQSHYLV